MDFLTKEIPMRRSLLTKETPMLARVHEDGLLIEEAIL